MQTTRLAVVGLGNVGRRLLELIQVKRDLLRSRFDLELAVVAASDSSGAAVATGVLDIGEMQKLKREHRGIADYPGAGTPGVTPQQMIPNVNADILIELSLTDLKHGQPGLDTIRGALKRKMHVVTANKGPLVLAYQELAALAKSNGVHLLHSAAVTGGLPTLNVGTRDLSTTVIEKIEGVVNGTTNYILSRMAQGQMYEQALKHAQEIGMAEADPSLDVDGWDAANKLVIIANAVLRRPTTLKDVSVEGIRNIKREDLQAAETRRETIKLIALAEKVGDDYQLSVKPTLLERSNPLAKLGAGMMGVMYHTDINGTIFIAIEEDDPYPTAAAVLRDIVQAATSKLS